MSRGLSFQMTKTERDAVERRRRVQEAVMHLLEMTQNVSAQDVYMALDHTTPPAISPANSGNILALLARQGTLATIMGRRSAGATRDAAILYTMPPRKRPVMPVYGSEAIRPLTKQELMIGKARPKRERYVSMMYAPPNATPDEVMVYTKERPCVVSVHKEIPVSTQPEIPMIEQELFGVTLKWPGKKRVTG